MNTARKRKLKVDSIVSVSAIIIAIASLYVAYSQTQIAKLQYRISIEHNKKSVVPVLRLALKSGKGIGIENHGLGSAVIESVYIGTTSGEPLRKYSLGDLHSFLWDYLGASAVANLAKEQDLRILLEAYGSMFVIPADSQNYPFIGIRRRNEKPTAGHIQDFLRTQLAVEVCYSSIYRDAVYGEKYNRSSSSSACKAEFPDRYAEITEVYIDKM